MLYINNEINEICTPLIQLLYIYVCMRNKKEKIKKIRSKYVNCCNNKNLCITKS